LASPGGSNELRPSDPHRTNGSAVTYAGRTSGVREYRPRNRLGREATIARLKLVAHSCGTRVSNAAMHEPTRRLITRGVPPPRSLCNDVDEATWSSWKPIASAFAAANQASVTKIKDGVSAGPAFFDHVARLGGQCSVSPSATAERDAADWTRRTFRPGAPRGWELLHRADDARLTVARAPTS